VKASHKIRPVFDDPNLVSTAGLVPALLLAETAGLHDLLDQRLSVESPNPAAKAACVIGGMLAGADSIDGLDLLRHGAMGRLFGGLRAPSTLGTYLRAFTHGHVQQLDAVGTRVLAGLTTQVPGLIAGAAEPGGLALIDVDDTIREVHGYAKQGAAYGYSKVRGLNAQITVCSTPLAAPVILGARLRRGNVASATGTARMLAQAITAARGAGVAARILARADSAYYGHAFVGTALRHGAWFSVTAQMTATVNNAIAGIGEDAWATIEYPNAIYDEAEQRWVSDAEVAEVAFTAFTGPRKADHVACRLVVRRIKRIQRLAGDGTEQGELFATYRHHAFITNLTLGLIEADQTHREHAIIEQVIAELKDGPLAHLPSGSYAANAAWLSHAVIAFNIARASAVAAGAPKIRWATLREQIIRTPARVAATGRRLILHMPRDWPCASHCQSLWVSATQPLTT